MCDLIPTCRHTTPTIVVSNSSQDIPEVEFEFKNELQMQVMNSVQLSLSPLQSFFNIAYIGPQQFPTSSDQTKSNNSDQSLSSGLISLVGKCWFVTETHSSVPLGSIALSQEQCKWCNIVFNDTVSVKIKSTRY